MDADVARDQELRRLATLVADGASVHLVCSDAPSHATVIAAAASVLKLLLAERRPRVGIASSQLIYRSGVKASVNRARTLTVGNWTSPAFAKVPLSWRHLHVRRLRPPHDSWIQSAGAPSPRLRAAIDAMSEDSRCVSDAASIVREHQPMAFVGAELEGPVTLLEQPVAFSHRRLEPRPDAETLAMPHIVANIPPVLPHDLEPMVDPPSDVVAHRVEDVIPRA